MKKEEVEKLSALPEWQRRILEERSAADEADPDAGSSWEEVKERILALS